MTIEECYEALEGDYSQAKVRLHSDAIIKKFVLKFPAQCVMMRFAKQLKKRLQGCLWSCTYTERCMYEPEFTKTWRVKFKAYRITP